MSWTSVFFAAEYPASLLFFFCNLFLPFTSSSQAQLSAMPAVALNNICNVDDVCG